MNFRRRWPRCQTYETCYRRLAQQHPRPVRTSNLQEHPRAAAQATNLWGPQDNQISLEMSSSAQNNLSEIVVRTMALKEKAGEFFREGLDQQRVLCQPQGVERVTRQISRRVRWLSARVSSSPPAKQPSHARYGSAPRARLAPVIRTQQTRGHPAHVRARVCGGGV